MNPWIAKAVILAASVAMVAIGLRTVSGVEPSRW